MVRLLIIGLVLLPVCAWALTEQVDVDGVSLTIYAPDWTWQRQNVNVLVVAQNGSGAPRSIHLELIPPAGKEDHFKFNGPVSMEFDVGPAETVRKAITDIYATDSFPWQVYDFAFVVRGQSETRTVPYALRTIRGAAVTSAKSALYLPVAVALIWSGLFAAVLPRLSSPGAWRKTQEVPGTEGEAARE